MRVHVVADVHGNSQALARAGEGADALIVLGDLINFVDYHDHSKGILGQVFGPDVVATFARLRTHGRPGELTDYARELWTELDDPRAVLEGAVQEQYRELFGALTTPSYLTPGNVDLPHLWPEFLRDGVRMLDGEVADIGGLRVGFVGGLPLPPHIESISGGPWRPYVRPAAEYDAACAALTTVDVLCSHVPPLVAELAYDVVSRRAEVGSAALVRIIERDRPRAALFGHVHQPMAARARVGGTECVNVGHFRKTERPFVLSW
ncbi:metallophosphoesterase family protein [Pseudonocardia spinosispora]|uniref:metallophosphoesterase family protein n=1 Tax=Pseudonocardia spinosispora TaxID=103441 RepID=UPI000422D4E8|nr:metallophosphoesterase [Pseudonocardia spinosispora]